MPKIDLFVEDYGHEEFLKSLILRLCREDGIRPVIRPLSVRGGHGQVLGELRQYLVDLQRESGIPDMILVATDSNCLGYAQRLKEIRLITRRFPSLANLVVVAIPDPHIERWMLLDSAAFKTTLGQGCQPPDQKCGRDRYKILLQNAVRDAGVTPQLGGMEHARDIIDNMNLKKAASADKSFRKLLSSLRAKLRELKKG